MRPCCYSALLSSCPSHLDSMRWIEKAHRPARPTVVNILIASESIVIADLARCVGGVKTSKGMLMDVQWLIIRGWQIMNIVKISSKIYV